MNNATLCSYVVDYDEVNGVDISCGEPATFECCGEYYCHQCAHDWLDELEPHFATCPNAAAHRARAKAH